MIRIKIKMLEGEKERDRGEKEKALSVWGMVRDFVDDGSQGLTKFQVIIYIKVV